MLKIQLFLIWTMQRKVCFTDGHRKATPHQLNNGVPWAHNGAAGEMNTNEQWTIPSVFEGLTEACLPGGSLEVFLSWTKLRLADCLHLSVTCQMMAERKQPTATWVHRRLGRKRAEELNFLLPNCKWRRLQNTSNLIYFWRFLFSAALL